MSDADIERRREYPAPQPPQVVVHRPPPKPVRLGGYEQRKVRADYNLPTESDEE